MKCLPLLDRILVLQDPAPAIDPKPPHLEIPLARRVKPNTGLVVAVGPGRRHDDGKVYPVALEAGARVMFSPVGATPVEHNGAEHLFMREGDVFLLLN